MELRNSLCLIAAFLMSAPSVVSAAEEEPQPEEQKVNGFIITHPDAKDLESFLQSRRIKIGGLLFDEKLSMGTKTDFGWDVFLGSPNSNYSKIYLYAEPVKIVATSRDLEVFKDRAAAVLLSEDPTREDHWEIAGHFAEGAPDDGAIRFTAEPWRLLSNAKWRYKHALTDAVAGLENPNPLIREKAAQTLGGIGEDGRKFIPNLTKLVGDAEASVAASALTAIGYLGGPEAAKALPTLIAAIDREWVGGRVIETLGNLGEGAKDAVPALIEALSSEELRSKSITALGKIAPEDPRVKEALTPYLDHESKWIREITSEALAIKSEQAGR